MSFNESKKNNFSFLGQKRNIIVIVSIFVIVLLAAFLLLYLLVPDIFKSSPTITICANNTYDDTLRVVTDIDYEPFSYISQDGNYTGLDVELINEVANRLHKNLDLELLDWNEANERFISGQADIILNMETDLVVGDERMISTIPTAEKQYVVYGREKVSSANELYGKRIASLHRLTELGLDEYITYLDSYAEIFEALKNDEYDFAVCPIQVGNVFLEKMGLDDIRPSYAVGHIYGAMALSQENAELKDSINEVLSQLQKEGMLDRLDEKWITNRYQSMTLSDIIRLHPQIFIMFLVFVFAAVLLLALTIIQHMRAKDRNDYTMKLKENLETIERQSAELIEAKERAEASSKAKSVFLSNMSHDIRTPMNAIIGYVNLAKDENLGIDDIRDYLTKIGNSGQHLLALINDVLEMSRIESGKMELDESENDLRSIMGDVRDMFSTQMKEKNIDYTVSLDGVTDSYVNCDKNRLNRILLNLISNAYKFTPEGGRISVLLKQIKTNGETGSYEFHVKDSGIGMTNEFAAKVFEAFERERTSTVSGIQGTGLGMAITKSIVDLMGGTIEVVTAPGKGTEFIVNVTFRLCKPLPDTETSDFQESSKPMLDFSQMRLLLVDDVTINREIASKILKHIGFEVETAVDGQEAVNKVSTAAAGYFDAVLMDIQMPVMDGYAAAKAIRALSDSRQAAIPIIAVTANAFSEDVQKACDAGMDGHIAKPIDINNMIATLTDVLTKRNME